MQHYSFDHQLTDGTTVLLIRLTIIALFHGLRPAAGPWGWPPRRLSLALWILCLEATIPFSRGPLLAHRPFPAWCSYRWPQFGYLAEAPRGNYAIFHGPLPIPLRLAPQAPESAPLNFASGCNYALFPRCTVGQPPLPSHQVAEGDYAQCLGPLCQRDTIVMLVATLIGAA